MNRSLSFWWRVVLAAIALLLALTRWLFFNFVSQRMDGVFLLLIGAAALIVILPWERISSFKAGGIEVALDKPEVKAALASLDLEHIENQQLKKRLSDLSSEIEKINGGRILWIDDKPYELLNERRLLRALGVQSVMAITSEDAEATLMKDNDFDIIVTDVQRLGQSHELNNGVIIHEGVNFIVKLRQEKDPSIRSLPVLFYAAYSWPKLVKFTRPARELPPEAELSNTPEMLIVKTIKMLAEARSQPIKSKSKKSPTRVEKPRKSLPQ